MKTPEIPSPINELPAKAAVARQRVLGMIRSGQVLPGQPLPSERDLAMQLGMNHRTVRRGLDDLIRAGLVVNRPRLGNFVQHPQVEAVARVALVLPQWVTRQTIRHPLVGTLWNGVTDIFDQSQEDAQVHLLDYDHVAGNLWQDAGRVAINRDIKGVIVYLSCRLSMGQLQPLLDAGLQVVVISDSGIDPEGLDVPVVALNPERILRQAVRRLVEMGHKHVAMIHYEGRGDMQMMASVERIWHEHGLIVTNETLQGPEHPEGPEPRLELETIRKMLTRSARSTALVVTDELIASGVFRCCYELGLRIPDDLSLVAIYNNAPEVHPVRVSAPHTSRLTYGIARRAALMLQSLIKGVPIDERVVHMNCDIQWGDSVAEPAD